MGVGCTLQSIERLGRQQVTGVNYTRSIDEAAVLVHVSGDKYSRKGRRLVKVRAMEGRAPQLPVTKYDVEVPKALSDLAANASRIYTDGSWKESSSLLERVTGEAKRVEVGVGLVACRRPPRVLSG